MASNKIIAVVTDLMFTVKIQEAAKRAGIEVVFVKDAAGALRQATQNPAVMIIDLNATGVSSLDLIDTLKQNPETTEIKLLGYVSHVDVDLKKAAQQKGCDTVVPRSAFSQNLPTLLKRYAVPVTS
jgi:CheY-like chemotaxis protein